VIKKLGKTQARGKCTNGGNDQPLT
jgi:hypothetical protein